MKSVDSIVLALVAIATLYRKATIATCATCPFFVGRICTYSRWQRFKRFVGQLRDCRHHPDEVAWRATS